MLFGVFSLYFWGILFCEPKKRKGKKETTKETRMTSSLIRQPGGAGRPANGPPPAPFAVTRSSEIRVCGLNE